jgi:hypothetical protein
VWWARHKKNTQTAVREISLQGRGTCGFVFLLAAQAEVFSQRSVFELIENVSGRNVSDVLDFKNSQTEMKLA